MSRLAHVEAAVAKALERAAHYLPSQAPLEVFVHHNTLHAFQHLPFHEALAAAGEKLGAQGYLSEDGYVAAHRAGRISGGALDRAIAENAISRLPSTGDGLPSTAAVARTILVQGIRPETPAGLSWRAREERATRRVAEGVSAIARARVETDGVEALWAACRAAAPHDRSSDPTRRPAPRSPSPRDALVEVGGDDPNDLVHPVLVLLAGAFLDRGQAQWSMPDRENGMFAAFCLILSAGRAVRAPWLRPIGPRLRAWIAAQTTAQTACAELLLELGIEPAEIDAFVERTLLQLPGWAGMFHRVEPAEPRTRLLDFLAVRLTLDVLALAEIGRRLGHHDGVAELRRFAATLPSLRDDATSGDHDRAWPLFLLAQHIGLGARELPPHASSLLAVLAALDRPLRLRVWHEAYEARYRDDLLHAIAAQRAHVTVPAVPRFQLLTCIDDRSEGLRRHFEEGDRAHMTFGTAGFFNLAMAYQGIDDPTTFPLCPVVVTPRHEVHEEPLSEHAPAFARRVARRRRIGAMSSAIEQSSRSIVWGPVITAAVGFLTALPLLVTVFAPFVAGRVRRRLEAWVLPLPKTRLALPRAETDAAEHGEGFTIAEKAERVGAVLAEIGMTRGFARIVVVLGHDSSSANNPHIAAYSCGACGGRSGGPNARLFARMANRKEVRELLQARGIDIPRTTVFVGGVHETCADRITLHDVDGLPAELVPELTALQSALDDACKRHAHERCRRFASAPRRATADEAWRHVEGRGYDPSQARPELGHASNAACVVGRRSLTRGLFLDRRVFLASYDPTHDEGGALLERILLAVGPVGAGINLEYFFSTTDNEALGAGTKLPHNVTGLLGVMNGASSDLRTGLPRQMIEIHEPIRLQLVVEAKTSTLEAILARQPPLAELVDRDWVGLSAIDPDDGRTWLRRARAFTPWEGTGDELTVVERSLDWYRGRSDHLRPARIVQRVDARGLRGALDVRASVGDIDDT